MLNTAYQNGHPCVVRFPRACGEWEAGEVGLDETMPIGKGRVINEGKSIAIAAFGSLGAPLLEICQKHDLTLLDMRFIKPWDEQLIAKVAKTHRLIVTLEDGAIEGGIGAEIASYVAELNAASKGERCCQVIRKGIPDWFIMEDSRKQILNDLGLDADGIMATIAPYLEQV